MKSTGIVRKVDELGRIVLPVELRRTMDIVEKDALEIYVDGQFHCPAEISSQLYFMRQHQGCAYLPGPQRLSPLSAGAPRTGVK